MKQSANYLGRIVITCGVVLTFIAVGGIMRVVQPGGGGVLTSLRLADGSEYMITQTCNWSVEPYTVDFYMRQGAKDSWGWCYVDHEADRWRDVTMSYDRSAEEVVVLERGILRALLKRNDNVFWIDNGDFSRELAAPQAFYHPRYPMPLN